MNTSATGGYLVPTSSLPAEDTALEDQLQTMVVGITGIDGTLVRPRWQPNPPKQPAADVNWCAIGVMRSTQDTYAAIVHHPDRPDGAGHDEMQRHETIEVLASFYGPAGQGYANLLSDGLQIAQNREALYFENLALLDATDVQAAPALQNEQWIRRYDLAMRFRRQITRTYDVLNLLSADGTIQSEQGSQNWETPQET
jgi:hypothetical protein